MLYHRHEMNKTEIWCAQTERYKRQMTKGKGRQHKKPHNSEHAQYKQRRWVWNSNHVNGVRATWANSSGSSFAFAQSRVRVLTHMSCVSFEFCICYHSLVTLFEFFVVDILFLMY